MSIHVVSQDEESAPPAETGVKTGLFFGGARQCANFLIHTHEPLRSLEKHCCQMVP